MALPQPKVLNFTSLIVLVDGSTLICSFITSPQAGAPTRPMRVYVSILKSEMEVDGMGLDES